MLKIKVLIVLLSVLATHELYSQQIIRGFVVENDSVSVMPFVYIINKSNGNGTMSDNDGKFSLIVQPRDTLICSYVGFLKAYIPVETLKRNSKGEVKLVLVPIMINLNAVTVTSFKLKPYEREYMNSIIEQSKIKSISYFQSPFSALYMQYSKEGKQIRKLAQIFEDLMIEEQVQKKLSREILVRLTGDENIDYMAFRKYCYYVNDFYIISHDGIELYSKVMDCYHHWKAEGRHQPLKLRENAEN
ncbi:MAG: carboxypeptidase-like regulatory domain-containing protein [bacterium]|nr:carboxypeptidase-like regulatory domain-containing protein [bacterium]